MNSTVTQLCAYYLDGNDEAAFEVFEYAGPQGLRQFLGFGGTAQEWKQLYLALLDESGFLDRLCEKYASYMSNLIQERGVATFREVLQIEDPVYNLLVARVWERLLDGMLEGYMKGAFRDRRKSHSGEFFKGLRNLLRRQIGF